PKTSGLPKRMAEFVSVPGLQARERRPSPTEAAASEVPANQGVFARLEETLDIAQIKTSPTTLVFGTVAGTILAFVLLYAATGSIWWALLAFLVPLGVREYVARKLARRRKAFAEQLPDALQVVSAALRSGQSFAGALAVVVDSGGEPMRSEMQQV